ncbi:MAG: BatD family protein [Spirochaetaceae bacterium]|jgi:hypothetical protein|nr:BatD family protein [Spirochaetaceae bacterium]
MKIPQCRIIKGIPLRFLLLIFCAGVVFAQQEERLTVISEVSVDNIFENTPFSITLIIDHPQPEEVTTEPPDFADMLNVTSIQTTSVWAAAPSSVLAQAAVTMEELMKNSEGAPSSAWRSKTEEQPKQPGYIPAADFKYVTQVKYTLVPLKSGIFTVGVFKVTAAGKTGSTWPLQLTIQSTPGVLVPTLRWIGPSRITAGEEAFFWLELVNRELVRGYGAASFFEVDTAPNAIIDRLPSRYEPAEENVVLRLRIIPLEGGSFTLHGRSRYGGKLFPLPAKTITFIENASSAKIPPPLETPAVPLRIETPVETQPLSFNWEKIGAPFVFASSFQKTVSQARDFWEQKRYAEALALLRQTERDSVYAPALPPLRAALEDNLGLLPQHNEPWRLVWVFALSGIVFFVLICVIFHIIRKKIRMGSKNAALNQYARQAGALYPLGFFVVSLAAAAFACAPITKLLPKNGAVLLETAVFPIPEPNETPDSLPRFKEGRAVHIRAQTENFLYVYAEGERTGWVPKDNALQY